MSNYNTNKRYFETVLSKKENICKAEITLNIANIMITQCYNDISYIGYEAKSTTKSTICKHCLKEITRFKQYKTTYTIYAKYNSKIILLKLSNKQYYCQDCKKTTTEKLIDKKEKKQKTKNFTQTIIDTLQENVSYSMIARTHKISVSNVIRCFDEVAKQIEISKDKDKIKHISINELRFVKSKQANYQFIIVDTTTRKIQEILQDRKQSVIKEHLKDNYKNIQTVSQDLWKPYKTVVKSLYEEVEIIPDRFHVIRQFTLAFTRERIKLQKQEGIKTNRNWKILTKRQRNLDEKGKEKLEELLKKHKQLEIIHTAKEKAYETFKRQSVEEYREKLEKLKEYVKENNIQEFKKAIKTIQIWEQDIENMFKYDITNGVVERINRSIKQSKNIAYGYRNLERATKLVQYRVNKCTLKVS